MKKYMNQTEPKLKLSTSRNTIKKMKRQHTVWDKIFANDVFDKGLKSGIYRHGQM